MFVIERNEILKLIVSNRSKVQLSILIVNFRK